MDPKVVKAKIARLKNGHRPRVLDLFSGCGGLSLGFCSAGYEITAAIEYEAYAAKSHGVNFHNGDPRHCIARDITKTKPVELTEALGLGDPVAAFDVIVGGPPCQAFARVGRSKLREVADHPEAYRHDPRARLYIEYLNYVEACLPLAVVMENVPDMLNHGGHNIADEVSEVLTSRGYHCRYTLLNAVHYGVPQMRERMFLIAIHQEIAQEVSFPFTSHMYDLPSGYEGTRNCALKLLQDNPRQHTGSFYLPSPDAQADLLPAVTAKQAVQDMPAIDARALLTNGKLKRGARRFDAPIPWNGADRLSEYGKLMRNWPGFSGSDTIADHVIRYLPRDYELFSRLRAGDQYPQAYKMAEKMFEETLETYQNQQGRRISKNSREWTTLKNSIVPPYDPGKFPNKWRKMEPDAPCRTLLAHLGKDSYSHIHYDSRQARTISVREAARLQSFPDGFIFCGTMNPAFQQIGNAVPPLLAMAIATHLKKQITEASK
ncbi:MAG: DNA cytosine methyltransferase [Desulfovibrio sp.]|jgi:DNA (cytosine-5)-methyltransferase 1|nr:DNA cytosine methyltransferase [Desulfovibrio sp.]